MWEQGVGLGVAADQCSKVVAWSQVLRGLLAVAHGQDGGFAYQARCERDANIRPLIKDIDIRSIGLCRRLGYHPKVVVSRKYGAKDL